MTQEEAKKIMEEGEKEAANSVWTVKNMLRTKETWLISIALGIELFVAGGFMPQAVPIFQSKGLPQGMAMAMMAVTGIMAFFGSMWCGWLDEKVGTWKAIIVSNCIGLAGAIFGMLPGPVFAVLTCICIGILMGGSSNYLMSIIIAYWGRFHFTNAQRVIIVINQIVGAGGVLFIAQAGAAFGFMGSFVLMAVLSIVSTFMIIPVKADSIAKRQAQLEAERAAKSAI
jgi:MFS family permease